MSVGIIDGRVMYRFISHRLMRLSLKETFKATHEFIRIVSKAL